MSYDKYYAGIGSRRTPPQVLQVMRALANKLEPTYGLRSGAAPGADSAFESGVRYLANQQIFLPSRSFQGRVAGQPGYFDASQLEAFQQALATVPRYHGAPHLLSDFAQKLMARNAMQILGPDLRSPSSFVIAWTPGAAIDGREAGGTGQALRMARDYGIPIRNLADPKIMRDAIEFLRG